VLFWRIKSFQVLKGTSATTVKNIKLPRNEKKFLLEVVVITPNGKQLDVNLKKLV
jgi:hypothetical protein